MYHFPFVLTIVFPKDQSLWAKLPFIFTIFGAGVGFALEFGLLVTGSPFQMMKTPFTRFIQMIRFLNIGPVVATIFFFVCSFTIEDAGLRTAMLYLSAFAGFAMATALFYGAGAAIMPLIILGTQTEKYDVPKMKEAFEKLYDDLEELDKKWTSTSADREHNYNYFRAVPSVLRTGPGY